VDSVEAIYGLVAIGLVDPRHLKRNSSARPGDKIVLGKALGVGVYSAAHKAEQLSEEQYRALIDTATKLNTPGPRLARLDGVHALTDVTGFGLLGHLVEVCEGAGVRATVRWDTLPFLPDVDALARAGHVTGASGRNWAGYGNLIDLGGRDKTARQLLTDPQTSGGLLVTCSPAAVEGVLAAFRVDGFDRATVIGDIQSGTPGISIV
jgi:selenide, water dikinase